MTFDYFNSSYYSGNEQSYSNFNCTGDFSEGNCTYDVVDDCEYDLIVECYQGTCCIIVFKHNCGQLKELGFCASTCMLKWHVYFVFIS